MGAETASDLFIFSPRSRGRIRGRLIRLVAMNVMAAILLLVVWAMFSLGKPVNSDANRANAIVLVPVIFFVASLALVYVLDAGTIIVDARGLRRIGRAGKTMHINWCEVDRIRATPQGARLKSATGFLDVDWFSLAPNEAKVLRYRLANEYLPGFDLEQLGPGTKLGALLIAKTSRPLILSVLLGWIGLIGLVACLPLGISDQFGCFCLGTLFTVFLLPGWFIVRDNMRWQREMKARHPEFPWRQRLSPSIEPGQMGDLGHGC